MNEGKAWDSVLSLQNTRGKHTNHEDIYQRYMSHVSCISDYQ